MQATGHMDVEIQHFRSSEDLLERWNKHTLSAHLFLLDIEFPHEMNGMALAREIRSCDDAVPLAFITHYGEYVYDGLHGGCPALSAQTAAARRTSITA